MSGSETTPNNGLAGAKFIDLFAGIGGFHLAMESAGLECVFASEWDRHAARVYENNFGMKPHGDINQIDEEQVPEHDVLCGGFPCQAFSISGKRRGFDDTRGTLFFELARIAKARQPKVMFMENVRNFAQHDDGKTLETVLATLDEIGYTVFHQVVNAAELGFPTARRRIYLVAFRKDLGVDPEHGFKFPKPAPASARQPLKNYLQSKKDALDQVRPLENVNLIAKKADPKAIERRLKRRPGSPVRIGIVGNGGQGERVYSAEGPAITFSAYGGGIASKTGAYWINGLARKLTPRECANVMGFPKTFKITQRPQQAYKQFGNSVVVGVLKLIARQIDFALRQASGEDTTELEKQFLAAFEAAIAPGLTHANGDLDGADAQGASGAVASLKAAQGKKPTAAQKKAAQAVIAQLAAEDAPKRGRGRPRNKPIDAALLAPKRPRGRPRKTAIAQAVDAAPIGADALASPATGLPLAASRSIVGSDANSDSLTAALPAAAASVSARTAAQKAARTARAAKDQEASSQAAALASALTAPLSRAPQRAEPVSEAVLEEGPKKRGRPPGSKNAKAA